MTSTGLVLYFCFPLSVTLFQICNLGSGGWAAVYFSKKSVLRNGFNLKIVLKYSLLYHVVQFYASNNF